jgi:hypothetical protein
VACENVLIVNVTPVIIVASDAAFDGERCDTLVTTGSPVRPALGCYTFDTYHSTSIKLHPFFTMLILITTRVPASSRPLRVQTGMACLAPLTAAIGAGVLVLLIGQIHHFVLTRWG